MSISLLRLALRVPSRSSLLLRPTTYRVSPLRTFTTSSPLLAKKDKSKDKEKDKKDKNAKKTKPTEDDEYHDNKKRSRVHSTEDLIPGSQQPISDPIALAEYNKTESAMKTAVDWFKRECAANEVRMSGRVTTSILSPVRVTLGADIGEPYTSRLEEVSTVGVKDGTMLLVTPFEDKNIKPIEKAIWDAAIPGVAPQRMDARTIKIPIGQPTVEARQQLFQASKRKAEEMRVQIRKLLQTSLKKGGWGKRSVEVEEFQKLCDRHVADIDKVLADLQRVAGGK